MSSEKTIISIPKLTDFNNRIKEIIDEKVKKSRMELMESIAKGENYDLEYLIDKYGGEYVKPKIQYSISPTTLKAVEDLPYKEFEIPPFS